MLLQALRVRQPLTALGKLTLAGLVGSILSFGFLLLLIGQVVSQIAVIMVVLLVVSILVATGWRWTPLVGALMAGFMTVGGQSFTMYHLSHPGDFGFFAETVVNVACALLALVAGIGATIQNYRRDQRTPRWLASGLSALAGLVVGALLIGGLVATAAPGSVSATGAGGEPTVHMGPGNFVTSSVNVPKGSKLLLVDDGTFLHILANGTWRGSTAQPEQQPGAPVVNNVQVNANSVDIGPFNTAGTYSIYCTIHPGMTLTIVVS